MRKCSTCQKEKPEEDFPVKQDRVMHYCTKCKNRKQAAWQRRRLREGRFVPMSWPEYVNYSNEVYRV